MSVLDSNALLIDCGTGEAIMEIQSGCDFSVRSASQCNNDKNFKPVVNVNKGGRFVKVMFSEMDLIKKFENTPKVLVLIAYVRHHIQYRSNYLVKDNGKPYRAADIARDMGVSRQMVSVYISQLKKENVLAETRHDGLNYLVMNPYYFLVSNEIWKSTVDLFG